MEYKGTATKPFLVPGDYRARLSKHCRFIGFKNGTFVDLQVMENEHVAFPQGIRQTVGSWFGWWKPQITYSYSCTVTQIKNGHARRALAVIDDKRTFEKMFFIIDKQS